MKRANRLPHASHERWLVSYADFITLMFAFFVVLYASSQTDIRKQAQVAHAINQAFKALGLFQPASKANSAAVSPDLPVTPVNIVLGDALSAAPSAAVRADFERMHRELQARLSNQIAQHVVALHIGREGLVISLREAGFYDSGSTAPHAGSIGSINSIVSVLKPTPYDIRIEGHTDNIPIHTGEFSSNWELSAGRATRMTRLFIEHFQFDPRRLAAAGYGQYHPVASNDSSEGRGQNRRVDIIVLPAIDGIPQIASLAEQSRTAQNAAAAKLVDHSTDRSAPVVHAPATH
ncbi:MAG TPA: flagellar motor protein MotB [Silvibacterium sp.]|jgi:chemotaxis protein MotB|nr:flagellar motor protein MotB [Silvibacterium sp.]